MTRGALKRSLHPHSQLAAVAAKIIKESIVLDCLYNLGHLYHYLTYVPVTIAFFFSEVASLFFVAFFEHFFEARPLICSIWADYSDLA